MIEDEQLAVEFFGGPADGQLQVVFAPGGVPPRQISFYSTPPVPDYTGAAQSPFVRKEQHVYGWTPSGNYRFKTTVSTEQQQ